MIRTHGNRSVKLWHLDVDLLVGELDGGEHHDLVPGHVKRETEGGVGVTAKLEHYWAPTIDHQIKPSVLPCHGEALISAICGHPHSYEPHPIRGHHLASDHGSAAKMRRVI